ncbi:uncharacterized [Tachysurus ichikawai]
MFVLIYIKEKSQNMYMWLRPRAEPVLFLSISLHQRRFSLMNSHLISAFCANQGSVDKNCVRTKLIRFNQHKIQVSRLSNPEWCDVSDGVT